MIVYTTGYSGRQTNNSKAPKFQAFADMVARRNLLVCDIRFRPWSRAACWRGENMEAALGEAYLWIPDLGNVNYNKDADIEIRNPARGVKTMLDAARSLSRVPLMLCACETHYACHRLTIAQSPALTCYTEIKGVIELGWWDDAGNGGLM